MKPRLLLADDHTLVMEGIARLLGNDFELAGSVSDGRSLLVQAASLKPDLILSDIGMPLLNGLDAVRQLKKTEPGIKVIFVTMHTERAYVREAFRCGALGYVVKQSAASELVTAVNSVLNGRYYISAAVSAGAAEDALKSPADLFSGLTLRQREVLQLVAEGKAAKEIANVLSISPKTVEFHKTQIMDELGVRTTAELIRYAMEHGLSGT